MHSKLLTAFVLLLHVRNQCFCCGPASLLKPWHEPYDSARAASGFPLLANSMHTITQAPHGMAGGRTLIMLRHQVMMTAMMSNDDARFRSGSSEHMMSRLLHRQEMLHRHV